ncbi:S-adenosyl-L-methionine-dependent methyltransferase [Cubamyces sp. BRFM 1775]|nr:S-adenosyl-L-methionine-dependent methyltransferase [Cubamyces sp. BRFM 1775]
MSSLATLRALHATIGNALQDIERIYTAKDLDYPSLDIPFYQSDVSATDTSEEKLKQADAEKLAADPKIMQASSLIVAACGQLVASVHHPFFTAAIEGVQLGEVTAALSVLEASHTVEILRDAGPQGLHINELARKVDQIRLGEEAASTNDIEHLDPVKFGHVLRLLASQHILREVQPNVFANNRLSSILDTGKSLESLMNEPTKKYDETNGASAFIAMSSSELFRSIAYFKDWLLPSADQPKKPDTPFNVALNTNEQYYTWLERPENSVRLMQVSRAMAAASKTEGSKSIADSSVFPWETLPQNSVVVDVGGGIGAVSVQLATPHPHLRLIVQDRAQTVEIAPKIWGDAHKELFDSGRVSFQVQDFFEPQPASLEVPGVGQVQHPSAYIVTRVMHNWPDAECKKILRNLRAAAGSDTKLILHEVVLPLACTDASSAASEIKGAAGMTAPTNSALLPNFGKAAICGYLVDIMMMTMMNSRERTLEEMREMVLDAGWKIVSVDLSSPPIAWGYLVAVPV